MYKDVPILILCNPSGYLRWLTPWWWHSGLAWLHCWGQLSWDFAFSIAVTWSPTVHVTPTGPHLRSYHLRDPPSSQRPLVQQCEVVKGRICQRQEWFSQYSRCKRDIPGNKLSRNCGCKSKVNTPPRRQTLPTTVFGSIPGSMADIPSFNKWFRNSPPASLLPHACLEKKNSLVAALLLWAARVALETQPEIMSPCQWVSESKRWVKTTKGSSIRAYYLTKNKKGNIIYRCPLLTALHIDLHFSYRPTMLWAFGVPHRSATWELTLKEWDNKEGSEYICDKKVGCARA